MITFNKFELKLMAEALNALLKFTKEVYKVVDIIDNTKLNEIVELVNRITDEYDKRI